MLHIPLLRRGVPYKSLDVVRVQHHRTLESFVEISQANTGLIRRDLSNQHSGRQALSLFSVVELIQISAKAAKCFLNDKLPLGDAEQSPQDYIEQVSATTGLPYVMVRSNMTKVHNALLNMESVLNGLTRNIDLGVLDQGYGFREGKEFSFYPRTQSLGVVLPSNSPGVHSLWTPSIAMKIPLVLKPGSAEPWTPYRIIQSFIAAGCPAEAFSYYPTDHPGAGEILRNCGRGMLFGNIGPSEIWKRDPNVEVHGPGYSKIIIGEDCIDDWPKFIDVMVASIIENGGRSCINASGVWVTSRADEIAAALAERLASIRPLPAEDPQANLAPFADPEIAEQISKSIDDGLASGGAIDVTASYRSANRIEIYEGCSYLLPTIIKCDSPQHALSNQEFLFPFASVVQVNQDEIPDRLGKSLVVTAITNDTGLIKRLLSSPLVDRLNIGPVPTNRISWDQPHEGNLFDHLYARRAFQRSPVVA